MLYTDTISDSRIKELSLLFKNPPIVNTMRHLLCGCTTNAGTQCHRAKAVGSNYCWQHKDCKNPFTGKVSPKKKTSKPKPASPKITSGRGKGPLFGLKTKLAKKSPTPTIKVEKTTPEEPIIEPMRTPTPKARTPTPKAPTPKAPTPKARTPTPRARTPTPTISPKQKSLVNKLKKVVKDDEGINVDRLRIAVNRVDPTADVTAQAIAEFTNDGDFTNAFKLIEAKAWLDIEISQALTKYLKKDIVPIIEQVLENTQALDRKKFPAIAKIFRKKGLTDIANTIESYIGSAEGPEIKQEQEQEFEFYTI